MRGERNAAARGLEDLESRGLGGSKVQLRSSEKPPVEPSGVSGSANPGVNLDGVCH